MKADLTLERLTTNENVLLVHVQTTSRPRSYDNEFRELAHAAACHIVHEIYAKVTSPNAKFFLSSGKVDEIEQSCLAYSVDLVIVDHDLSPAQERNLERRFKARVIDRTGLILDIFAQRAHTSEGKLQVELAQLEHLATRLVRGWTHLERQKGGIGLRGPGETQLETDRRLVRVRIKNINRRLVKVKKQRELGRVQRKKAQLPTISLVGYTNAGKSTLFNALTQADVLVKDLLFATLDPTLRKLTIENVGNVILVDTVGFIRELPHELVEAFHATLEETHQADLILHVIDAADPNREENIEQVERVLREIDSIHIPRIEIYNKIDLLHQTEPHIDRNQKGYPERVWVGAFKNKGIDLVKQVIGEIVQQEMIQQEVCLSPKQSDLRAKLYALHGVQAESIDEQGRYHLIIRLPKRELSRLGLI